MLKKKTQKQLKIIVSGYDISTTEEATKLFSEKLSQLKLDFSKPVPLKTKRKVITVPISPHKHKDAQEQFERRTHRRLITVSDITPHDLENLARINHPNTANVKLKSSF